jgi:hypothetical protein
VFLKPGVLPINTIPPSHFSSSSSQPSSGFSVVLLSLSIFAVFLIIISYYSTVHSNISHYQNHSYHRCSHNTLSQSQHTSLIELPASEMQYIHVLASLAFIYTVAAVPSFQCAGSIGIAPLDPDLDIGLNMINDARTDSGRTELVWDKALRDSALLRACQLAKSHLTDHHPLSGEARYLEKVATCHSPPMTHQSMAWTLQSAANSWLFVGNQNTGDPVKDAVTDWSHRGR